MPWSPFLADRLASCGVGMSAGVTMTAMLGVGVDSWTVLSRCARHFHTAVCVVAIVSAVTSVIQLVAAATALATAEHLRYRRTREVCQTPSFNDTGQSTFNVSGIGNATDGESGTSGGAGNVLLGIMGGLDVTMIALALLTAANTRSSSDNFVRLLPWLAFLYVYVACETTMLTCCWLLLVLPQLLDLDDSISTLAFMFGSPQLTIAYWSFKITFHVLGSVCLMLRMTQLAIHDADSLSILDETLDDCVEQPPPPTAPDDVISSNHFRSQHNGHKSAVGQL